MRLDIQDGIALRYRLVPGSTVRWVVRMDVDLTIESPDAPTETMVAMVTSALDCEVVRLEGQTALVRAFAHRSDFWVKSGTLDEDDVADPMGGFVKAFLLDDLGSVVPVADERASALAQPDDGNPGRALLLALFPPFPEERVESSMQWEVGLHHSWSTQKDIGVRCGLSKLERDQGQMVLPVVLHGTEYEWTQPADESVAHAFASSGSVRFAAETRVDPRDGWAAHTEGTAQLVSRYLREDGVARTVTTQIKLVADRE